VIFVRYESPVLNSRGGHTGIFGSANGLARSGTAKKPRITCWFKSSADHLLGRLPGYLALLDRHGVAWTEHTSSEPGHILYEDAVQVVVAPLD